MKNLFAAFLALLLGGCASAGFKVAATQPVLEPQEPWQSVALWDLNLRGTSCLTVVPILLPQPLPTVWRWEINDHRRVYSDSRVLRRDVWRVVAYDGKTFDRVYNAVIGSDRRALHMLVPECGRESDERLVRQNFVVASADGCFVLTTEQDVIPLHGGMLPEGFFGRYPSPIRALWISRKGDDTPEGRRFIAGLRMKFPMLVGKRHSARADVADVAMMTSEATYGDRMISKGSLPISAGLVSSPVSPLFFASTVIRNRGVFNGLCAEVHEMLGVKPETVSYSSE